MYCICPLLLCCLLFEYYPTNNLMHLTYDIIENSGFMGNLTCPVVQNTGSHFGTGINISSYMYLNIFINLKVHQNYNTLLNSFQLYSKFANWFLNLFCPYGLYSCVFTLCVLVFRYFPMLHVPVSRDLSYKYQTGPPSKRGGQYCYSIICTLPFRIS